MQQVSNPFLYWWVPHGCCSLILLLEPWGRWADNCQTTFFMNSFSLLAVSVEWWTAARFVKENEFGSGCGVILGETRESIGKRNERFGSQRQKIIELSPVDRQKVVNTLLIGWRLQRPVNTIRIRTREIETVTRICPGFHFLDSWCLNFGTLVTDIFSEDYKDKVVRLLPI